MTDQKQTRPTQCSKDFGTEIHLGPCRHRKGSTNPGQDAGKSVREGFLVEVMFKLSLGRPMSHPASQ